MRDARPARRAPTASVNKEAKFSFGVSTLPYYTDVPGAPQNTIIGGASLWAMSGKTADEYKGVAAFFKFLSSPRCKPPATSAPATCRSPQAAFELTEKSGFYEKNPGTDVAVNADDPQDHRQVARRAPRQLRADPRHRWTRSSSRSGPARRPRRKALDEAVRRGNELLEKFQAANKS